MVASVVDSVIAGDGANSVDKETASLTVSGSNTVVWAWAWSTAGSVAPPDEVLWGGDDGTPMEQIGDPVAFSPYGLLTLWELKNPTAGAHTVYALWPSNQDTRMIYAVSAQGVDQTTPTGTVAVDDGSSSTLSLPVDSTSGQLVLDCAAFIDFSASAYSLVVGAGQTQLENLPVVPYDGGAGSHETASGSTTTMSWTLSAAGTVVWASIGFAANDAGGGTGPSITDVDTDEVVLTGQTSVAATGANMGTTNSDRAFTLRQGSTSVSQTETGTGTATAATLTIVTEQSGADIKFGTAILRVTRTADSEYGERVVTVNPPSGHVYINIGTPDTEASNRITAVGDIDSDDQLEFRGVGGGAVPTGLNVETDGTFWFDDGETPTAFGVRVWDASDSTWGTWATQSMAEISASDEVDSGINLTGFKRRAAATSTETDSAQGLSRKKTKAVGIATSASACFALGKIKVKAMGLPSSANQSLALVGAKLRATGLSSGVGTSLSLGKVKTKSTALSAATDLSLGLTTTKAASTGLSTSSNAAFSLSQRKTKSAGLSAETNESLSLSSGLTIQVGLSTESNTARDIGRQKARGVTISADTGTVLGLSRIKIKGTGLPSDSDSALLLTRLKARTTGLSTDLGFAPAMSHLKLRSTGLSSELSTSLTLLGSGGSGEAPADDDFSFLDSTLLVQEALYEELTASSALASASGGTPKVFDAVPKGEAAPFITIGDLSSSDDSCKGEPGQSFDLTVHVWDEGQSSVRLKQMMAAIIFELHDNDLAVADADVEVWLVRYISSGVLKDPDGVTLHGVIRFQLFTNQGS